MRIVLGGASRKVALEPSIVKRFVQLPHQELGGAVSEIDLLRKVLDLRADLQADHTILRELPPLLYATNRKVTVIACDDRIIALEPGDTGEGIYGLALDVGTTTVVGALVELSTGKDLTVASAVNGQTRYGHDVIARIKFSMEVEGGLEILQEAAQETVNRILIEVAESAQIDLDQIYEITVVGNATMSHLLLGISPKSLGHLPYVPVFSAGFDVPAAGLGFKTNPRANVHV
jgi:uncharacterized 2Fe-2S/4Fe-4S cluster protein (DUF4445 family)